MQQRGNIRVFALPLFVTKGMLRKEQIQMWMVISWPGPPDEVEQQVQDARQQGLHQVVELHHQVHHVLQALRARLVQPRVHLGTLLLVREGRRVSHLEHVEITTCFLMLRFLKRH